MKNLPLHIKIIIGLVAGIIYAFISSALGWNDFTINWINPFGTIFIRLLKFIAVPLVLFSIIGGVSSLSDISKLGRLGAKTLGLYLLTTVIAVGIGLLLVNIVKPGKFIDEQQQLKNRIEYEKWVQATDGVEGVKDDKNVLTDPEYRDQVEEIASDETLAQAAQHAEAAAVQEKMVAAEKTKDTPPITVFSRYGS
ncbi:dicarboxylate/amino acid:cation symporter [Fulvivirga maritima]|uniref:dicarboxylate/amino acid:cation symporter n=1 Tax=Fulvivirga maritima TaxID=2904247 RepID=UPI001F4763D8|nr:cation:dicarboxylase symporter family transporter [Fulvivirga maritima]UII28551.1 dicarboxylate/amino acid:cation symporter [Fulvivirga maritima]